MKNLIKVVAVAAVVGVILTLALELKESRYELRQQVDANANWRDFSDFQNLNHIKVTQAQQAEIARLQLTRSNSIAAH